MRDEHHGRVDVSELALEPLDAVDVEVVRGLVEQQQVGSAGECARERRARELAAREGRERAVEIVVGEAEPAHDGAGVVAPSVAARVLEARLRPAVARERARVVVAGGHRLLEPAQLALGGDEVVRAGEDVLAQAQRPFERRPLVVQRDARALLERELAAVLLGLAGEDPEQRRLAGAVRAGERDPVAALDFERDAVEEQVSCELLAQVGCDHDGHAPRVEGAWRARDYSVSAGFTVACWLVLLSSWPGGCLSRHSRRRWTVSRRAVGSRRPRSRNSW